MGAMPELYRVRLAPMPDHSDCTSVRMHDKKEIGEQPSGNRDLAKCFKDGVSSKGKDNIPFNLLGAASSHSREFPQYSQRKQREARLPPIAPPEGGGSLTTMGCAPVTETRMHADMARAWRRPDLATQPSTKDDLSRQQSAQVVGSNLGAAPKSAYNSSAQRCFPSPHAQAQKMPGINAAVPLKVESTAATVSLGMMGVGADPRMVSAWN